MSTLLGLVLVLMGGKERGPIVIDICEMAGFLVLPTLLILGAVWGHRTSPLPAPELPRPGEPTTVGGSRMGPRWPR